MLTHYLTAFAKLKADRARWRGSLATNQQAPYKPFLLLAVLDLIAQGQIPVNFITLTADLEDAFRLYCVKVLGSSSGATIALPFYHLKGDGFWHLIATPGNEPALASPIRTRKQQRYLIAGAKLDDDLYPLLLQPAARDRLRLVLIETYFAPEVRPVLVQVGTITAQSFAYSHALLRRAQGAFSLKEAPAMDEVYLTESRTVGFRRVVIETYAQTCALCRLRLVTPEGYTAVSAAHIVPYAISHNDDPRNGLALCGLHHWAFDQGLVTVVAATNTIRVSPLVPADDPHTTPLRELDGRTIHLPHHASLYPAPAALRWHQREVYRDTAPPLFG